VKMKEGKCEDAKRRRFRLDLKAQLRTSQVGGERREGCASPQWLVGWLGFKLPLECLWLGTWDPGIGSIQAAKRGSRKRITCSGWPIQSP
jgi:hypothetical protein